MAITHQNASRRVFAFMPKGLLICLTATSLSLLQSPSVMALESVCTLNSDARNLKVDIPGQEYLCEVSVTHESSGLREVKWYAQNDSLFCSARAYELRLKYEETWGYSCSTWLNEDGVDTLSSSQRAILDQRLKALIQKGKQSTPPFNVVGVKAIASTPLDKQPGKIALQFFTSEGDFTEIINDTSDEWTITVTISNMKDQLSSDIPISSALVQSITDTGTLQIRTTLKDSLGEDCFGTQTLEPTDASGVFLAQTSNVSDCLSSRAVVPNEQ